MMSSLVKLYGICTIPFYHGIGYDQVYHIILLCYHSVFLCFAIFREGGVQYLSFYSDTSGSVHISQRFLSQTWVLFDPPIIH